MTTVTLVRHGQASFGGANYDQLSPLGRRQSTLLGEHLRRLGRSFDAFFTGDMLRQRDTALGVIDALGAGQPLATSSAFNEYDFLGVLRLYMPIVARDNPHLSIDARKLFKDPGVFQEAFEKCIALWVRAHEASGTPAETWAQFCARAVDGIRAAATPERGNVLIATSGGVIAAALREALAVADDMAFALNWRICNASVHRFKLGRRGLSLLAFNDVAHLELAGDPALITYR